MFKRQLKVFQPSCQEALKALELARTRAPMSVANDPELLGKYMAATLLAR